MMNDSHQKVQASHLWQGWTAGLRPENLSVVIPLRGTVASSILNVIS